MDEENENNDLYKNTKETDINKNELIFPNTDNNITANYNTDDLEVFANIYAYGKNQFLRKHAFMIITLIIIM